MSLLDIAKLICIGILGILIFFGAGYCTARGIIEHDVYYIALAILLIEVFHIRISFVGKD